jgi:hypothetical protein
MSKIKLINMTKVNQIKDMKPMMNDQIVMIKDLIVQDLIVMIKDLIVQDLIVMIKKTHLPRG